MRRSSTAVWNGSGKEGNGHLTTDSGVMEQQQYSYRSRFEDGKGTNPEELVAAAHAGCFSMKLSFVLNEAGFTADKIETKCTITLESGTITESHLVVQASVPGMDENAFANAAVNAKENCPISKLLSTKITMEASLV